MSPQVKKTFSIITDIIEWVLIVIFLLIFIFIIIFSSNKPNGDKGGSLFGFETRLVLSDSMNADESFYKDKNFKIKSFAAGDCIFLNDCDYQDTSKTEKFYSEIAIGDVLTYYSNLYAVYITHRVIEIENKNNTTLYTLHGDNVNSDSNSNEVIKKSDNVIVGKVIFTSKFVGWIYNNYLSNKVALYLSLIIPALLGATYETVKIIREVKKGKDNKLKTEQLAKDNEIEALRQEIAQLKNEQSKNQIPKAEEKNNIDDSQKGGNQT